MASVSFEQLTKRFGEVTALESLSLQIADGEFMVFVGPSGCGKSTALRTVAGLEQPTSGRLRIGERVVNRVPPGQRDIAMVFQSYALYPHMTVRDNMAFGLRVKRAKSDEIARRVQEAGEILGLQEMLDRKPRELSGGQRQRVAVGRAIVRDPTVFLLDEPLSNLDAKLRTQTRIEIQSLHRRLGTTFIYVTHDQVEAMTMGQRIAVMREGVLQQCATPREIYETPTNRFVAGFIGSPTMNFFPVQINGTTARGAGFTVELPDAPGVARAVVGVRPEALSVVDDGPIRAEVDVVELLGADQYVYARGPDLGFTVRVAPDQSLTPGDVVRVAITGTTHVFDATSDEAVARLAPRRPA